MPKQDNYTSSNPKTEKLNIEIKISNRLRSVFASVGIIINDFYMEAGIFFIGGFNALLVATDIYTNSLAGGHSMAYAIILAITAFITVEGLAVSLVGAAAKLNNGWLWAFSLAFAAFFTFGHYQAMNNQNSLITEYVTLAIPSFLVVGYYARTLKVEAEEVSLRVGTQEDLDLARTQQIENDARARKERVEDQRIQFEQQKELNRDSQDYKLKMARIEAKKVLLTVPSESQASPKETPGKKDLETLKPSILNGLTDSTLSRSQLAESLGLSKTQLYRYLGTLNEMGEIIKNGNGYEVAK